MQWLICARAQKESVEVLSQSKFWIRYLSPCRAAERSVIVPCFTGKWVVGEKQKQNMLLFFFTILVKFFMPPVENEDILS